MSETCEAYRDSRYTLGINDGAPYIMIDGKTFALSCHPYEPCTYVKDGGHLLAAIHNAFDPFDAIKRFAHGGDVISISGKKYLPADFCRMLEYAADNLVDTDVSYIEGALAVEKMKELGATDPGSAVSLEQLGVRAISDRFSRSKKLAERVMYTEEGKVYVRIKG